MNGVFTHSNDDNDNASKDCLLGWDANNEFDFSSYVSVLWRLSR